jgi:hypothetical protein
MGRQPSFFQVEISGCRVHPTVLGQYLTVGPPLQVNVNIIFHYRTGVRMAFWDHGVSDPDQDFVNMCSGLIQIQFISDSFRKVNYLIVQGGIA